MLKIISVQLLHSLSMDLCNGPETVQAAVTYIFIFLLDVESDFHVSLPASILHQWNCGVIKMLTKTDKLPVQINALGNILQSLNQRLIEYNLYSYRCNVKLKRHTVQYSEIIYICWHKISWFLKMHLCFHVLLLISSL